MFSRSKVLTAFLLGLTLTLVCANTAPASAAPSATAKAGASEAHPIDLNTADSAALETVPGIGKSLSQRILAFREKNGAFQSVDDLLKVQGIGEKSIQKLRPYLTVAKAK